MKIYFRHFIGIVFLIGTNVLSDTFQPKFQETERTTLSDFQSGENPTRALKILVSL